MEHVEGQSRPTYLPCLAVLRSSAHGPRGLASSCVLYGLRCMRGDQLIIAFTLESPFFRASCTSLHPRKAKGKKGKKKSA